MKKFLSIFLTLMLIVALTTGSAFASNGNGYGKIKATEFNDIKGHWAIQIINKMQDYGILDGYEDGTFKPDKTLTQEELAVIIERLTEKLKSMEDEDADIDDDDDADMDDDEDSNIEDDDDSLKDVSGWAKNAVKKGFSNDYLNMKRFHSKVQCDRITASVAIARAMKLTPVPVKEFKDSPFKDRLNISDDDYGYLLALYKEGYIKGYPDGNFNPKVFLTRAQMAAIIEKIIDNEDLQNNDEANPYWDNDDSFVTASAITSDSVVLKWSGAKDDIGVTEYKVIYKLDGTEKVKSGITDVKVKITGLDAKEDYTFTVQAKDAAGNWSNDGPSVDVKTLAEDADTERPFWDSNDELDITNYSNDSVKLEWPDAEDTVGITGYIIKVYEKDADKPMYSEEVNEDVNAAEVTGLDDDHEYTFKVRAYDKAGNESAWLVETFVFDNDK